MLAEIKINQMRRCRQIRYNDMFLGNNSAGEVRSEWSDLSLKFQRNMFLITITVNKVKEGGKPIEEATAEYTEIFCKMEEWCDNNCAGFWTVWDNEDEVDADLPGNELKLKFMFEHEDDLILFIRDCAVLVKLSVP